MFYSPTYKQICFLFCCNPTGSPSWTLALGRISSLTYVALTSNNVTEKAKLVLAVGWAVDHKPYHLTLLKLALHHFRVWVGTVKRCRPKLFFGAPGVTTNPATVLGPTAQPTARTVVALSVTPSAPKKSLGRHCDGRTVPTHTFFWCTWG